MNGGNMPARPKILIIGDGLVGLATVCALADQPYDITWVGPQLDGGLLPPDYRSIVLNVTTKRWLDHYGLKDKIAPYLTPIDRVEVLESGSHLGCCFEAKETKWPSLGFVIPAHHLIKVLRDHAATCAVRKEYGTVEHFCSQEGLEVQIKKSSGQCQWMGDWILSAEGVSSVLRHKQGLEVRQKSYHQVALTGVVQCRGQAETTAIEYFSRQGPIAFLPRGKQQYGFVWIVSEQEVETMEAYSDYEFLQALAQAFGTRLGLFASISERASYPLALHWMPQRVSQGVVYLGNAAQSVHPVMGQGFNLAVRDIAAWVNFAEAQGAGQALSYSHALMYARLRESDRQRVIKVSDWLASGLEGQSLSSRCLRRLGLGVLNYSSQARSSFVQASLGEFVPWVIPEKS